MEVGNTGRDINALVAGMLVPVKDTNATAGQKQKDFDLYKIAQWLAAKENAGVAASLLAAHVAASNPHSQYATNDNVDDLDSRVQALENLLDSATDVDAVVNKLMEVLTAMENFPEGVQVLTELNNRYTKTESDARYPISFSLDTGGWLNIVQNSNLTRYFAYKTINLTNGSPSVTIFSLSLFVGGADWEGFSFLYIDNRASVAKTIRANETDCFFDITGQPDIVLAPSERVLLIKSESSNSSSIWFRSLRQGNSYSKSEVDTLLASKANTSYVDAQIAALVNSSPSALDTLNELAAALGNDANFATTVINALALKAPLASPTFTGNPAAPTQAVADASTKLATTQFTKDKIFEIEKAYTVSGTNTLTFAPSGPAAYVSGERWLIKIVNENTSSVTINRDGLGAKSVRIISTSTLLSGELKANSFRTIVYDGTNFILESATLPSIFDHLYFTYPMSRATDATTSSGAPPSNTLRWNDADHGLVTEIYVHISGVGTDKADFLSKLLTNAFLFIEDTITGSTEAWIVVSAVSSGSNWVTITVDNSSLTNFAAAGNPIRMYISHTQISGKNTILECVDYYAIITGQIFCFASQMRVLSPFQPGAAYVEVGADVGVGELGFLSYAEGVGNGAFYGASGIRKKSDGTFLVEFTY